eukprot:1138726-Pelagomonas_calceolata.AAC.1
MQSHSPGALSASDCSWCSCCTRLSGHNDEPNVCLSLLWRALQCSWDFLSWLTTADKLQFYEKAAGVCLFFRLFSLSIDYASGTPIWKKWTTRKKKKVGCRAGSSPWVLLCVGGGGGSVKQESATAPDAGAGVPGYG